jgi:hypothetical protein
MTQTTFSAQHSLVFDAALRDARTQLPRTADAKRADRGLVLALNGHVTLYSPTEAHVTSETDPEVVYQTTRWDCDCRDSVRRRAAAGPYAAPREVFCKHQYAVALMAMAHVNLALKGYVPEPQGLPRYPAVATGESGCTWSGYAFETPEDGWWFDFGDGSGGFYCSELDLELWDRTPCHVIQWTGEVTRWQRWLQGR